MLSPDEINAIPYLDEHTFEPYVNTSIYTKRLNYYYCSYAKMGYVNNTAIYRFTEEEELDDVRSLCSRISIVLDVLVWLAIVLGLPGNIMALITISTMPKTTGTFYISLLCASDLIALCTRGCNSLLTRYGVYYTSGLCRFMHFIMNYSATYSNWMLVFICFERFVTIKFPLKKCIYLTLKRARYSGLILAIVLFLFCLTYIFLTIAKKGNCVHNPSLMYFNQNIFPHIAETLYSFLPVALLFIFTTLVIIQLKKYQKARRLLLRDTQPENESIDISRSPLRETAASKKRRKDSETLERSITIMMMAAAIIFLLITVPYCLLYTLVIGPKTLESSSFTHARNKFLYHLGFGFNLMTHAINFYIYFVSARKFREHLWYTLTRRRSQLRSPVKPSIMSKSTGVTR